MEEVYKLIDRFEQSALSELMVDCGALHLAMKKGGAVSEAPVSVLRPISAAAAEAESEAEKGTAVPAPLVGTFYRSASPESEPFVTVGSRVKKGDVVGIIEAMKLMNEIAAPVDGTVCAVEAENETMVEYGQTLLRIKES